LQFDVVLSDLLLSLACLAFAMGLTIRHGIRLPLARAWILFFLSLALAAGLGTLVHGWFDDDGSFAHWLLWTVDLQIFALTLWSGWTLVAALVTTERMARAVRIWAIVHSILFLVLITGRPRFSIVIDNYSVTSFALMAAGLWRYRADRAVFGLWIGGGVAGAFAAAALQLLALDLPSLGLSHNALYHLVQIAALAALYHAANGHLRATAGRRRLSPTPEGEARISHEPVFSD
jgi:hypothetical protein